MLFTGNSFKLIPNVKYLSFAFNNINLQGTGVAEIGVSGSGIVKFRFANNKIYNESGAFVGVYDENSNTNISGNLTTGNYSFYIDGDLIASKIRRSSENYSKFFVNVTGANLTCNINLNSNDIPISITIPEKFLALSSITGRFLNNSLSNPFYIYDMFWQSWQNNESFFSGSCSGIVSSGTGIDFVLQDINDNRFDETLNFLLGFNTSLGQITGLYSIDKVSGLEPIETNLINDYGDVSVSMLFDGSGIPVNYFTYANEPTSKILTYEVFSSNLMGDAKDKALTVTFEAISPASGAYYESNYVTGFSLTNSGEYLYPPSAEFTGYYYVTGLNYNWNSLLLNSGCSGFIPVIFTGANGYGARGSGILSTAKIYLQNVYNAGINYYYMPTSFAMVTGGTGYLSPSRAILNTGIYANCYDVAQHFGYNYLIYSPFSAYGTMGVSAGYLTGVAMTVTGLVNGGTQTGYLVTGLDITNPGFGYNINSFPKMSFKRQNGDALTDNASGILTIKQSGYYDFTGHWSIQTGISNFDLVTMPISSGQTVLDSEQDFFTVRVDLSGKDHTQPIIGKLTVSTADGQSVYNYITGVRNYNVSTGFLKKKDILELIKIPANNELNFMLTQDELDVYYSSEAYKNSEFSINLGDLDF